MKLYLAKPRGFCAGVERAIEIVERCLERFGKPIYVRHEIVHNSVVVDGLREKGAVFVDEIADVPAGELVVFSAHGVAPSVVQKAEDRGLRILDATCPLVTKVHTEAKNSARRGHSILLVGHRTHVEVIGVVGEAEANTIVIENPEEAEKIEVPDADRLTVLTQTTLSVDEARDTIEVLKRRFPRLETPKKDDICYATQNRQDAVKALSKLVDIWLVIGDPTSSNSNRLRELGEARGKRAHLILDESEIEPRWFDGVKSIGLTSGASTPEVSVQGVVDRLKELGVSETVDWVESVETMEFALPALLRSGTSESGA